jgi:SAM-dependent methyltransferase
METFESLLGTGRQEDGEGLMNMKERGESANNVMDELESYLDGYSKDRGPLTILEAGCGSMTHISLRNADKIVGIDISEERLKRNPGIHERLVGDLQTYPLPEEAFDAIVCWNVIEHIADPRLVMENFFHGLKEDGILVLAFPNVLSLKGLVAKFTPYSLHVHFYRRVFGDRRKEEDFEQFPTYLRLFIEPGRLKSFAESRGFTTDLFRLYQGPVQADWRAQSALINVLFSVLGITSRVLTLGKIDLNLTDCVMVLRRAGKTRKTAKT